MRVWIGCWREALLRMTRSANLAVAAALLMTGALAYQESGLDHSKRSNAGAVGIMQVLPTTAADKNIGIPDVEKLENNVHAGHKYLRFLQDRYFDDPAIATLDRYLFTFAAYNSGPARGASVPTPSPGCSGSWNLGVIPMGKTNS